MVRMQCLPDLGGKVVDLLARPDRIVGHFPQLNQGMDLALPGRERTGPIMMMGIGLLEMFAPVTVDRVIGARRDEKGRLLKLRPVVEGGCVIALLAPDGRIVRRTFEWGTRWEEEWVSDREVIVRAPGMELRVSRMESRTLESAADSLFQLELPPGTKALEIR
jgi:hypothetical protein